jgi:hypothetical protein
MRQMVEICHWPPSTDFYFQNEGKPIKYLLNGQNFAILLHLMFNIWLLGV